MLSASDHFWMWPRTNRLSLFIRSLLARSLILILSLALIGGNGHVALHSGGAHSEPYPEEHAHHGREASHHHRHQHDKGLACCCDCLGCTSAAYLPPGVSITAAEFTAQIHYAALVGSLSGRALLPEPDPPRLSPLS
jgi:hypothetical protein